VRTDSALDVLKQPAEANPEFAHHLIPALWVHRVKISAQISKKTPKGAFRCVESDQWELS